VHRPLRAIVVGVVTAVTLVATGLPAKGEPTPSVSEIERQINEIWAQAEPTIEKYNEIHEQYRKNKTRQAQLQKQIEPLQRQVDLAQLRVGVIAARVYMGGHVDAVNAVLVSGSPETLADQLSILDQLAKEQQRHIAGVTTLKAKYDAQKKPIDDLVAQLAKQDADLAAKKKQIETQLTKLQQLRLKAYGGSTGTGSYRPWTCPQTYEPSAGYKAAKYACSQAGDPYVWAASGPNSYDCSGLTLASWAQAGVYLPHNAAAQRRSMPYVSRANLRLGDLVFYFSNLRHVAIYVGGGYVMHAPTFGDHVRMAPMGSVGSIHSYGRPNG
jgi:cell wall-associated NlpC family hydrolase